MQKTGLTIAALLFVIAGFGQSKISLQVAGGVSKYNISSIKESYINGSDKAYLTKKYSFAPSWLIGVKKTKNFTNDKMGLIYGVNLRTYSTFYSGTHANNYNNTDYSFKFKEDFIALDFPLMLISNEASHHFGIGIAGYLSFFNYLKWVKLEGISNGKEMMTKNEYSYRKSPLRIGVGLNLEYAYQVSEKVSFYVQGAYYFNEMLNQRIHAIPQLLVGINYTMKN